MLVRHTNWLQSMRISNFQQIELNHIAIVGEYSLVKEHVVTLYIVIDLTGVVSEIGH